MNSIINNYNTLKDFQRYIHDTNLSKYEFEKTEEYKKFTNLGYQISDLKFKKDWSNYTSMDSIQKFILENDIESPKDLSFKFPGLFSKIHDLGYKVTKFKYTNYKIRQDWSSYNTLDDFQKYIDDNNILYRTDDSLPKGLRERFYKLGFSSLDLTYKNDLNNWKSINTLEDFNRFLKENNIKSSSEFRAQYSGLYSKCRTLGIINKITYSTGKKATIFKDWSGFDFQKSVLFFKENNINSFSELSRKFPGLLNKLKSEGYHSSDFFENKRKNWSNIKTVDDVQEYINKHGITRPSDLEPGLSTKISKLNIKRSDLYFKDRLICWDNYDTIEKIQNFIDDNSILSMTDMSERFGGLVNKISRLNFSSLDFNFKDSKKFSTLELKVRKFLNDNNINFIEQYRFDNFRKYPFDFYLPDYNLVLEPGGSQHLLSVKVWGGEKGLLKNKKRDKIKFEYCQDNNILILYYFNFGPNKKAYELLNKEGYFGNWFTDFDKFTLEILNIIGQKKD